MHWEPGCLGKIASALGGKWGLWHMGRGGRESGGLGNSFSSGREVGSIVLGQRGLGTSGLSPVAGGEVG